jgi:HEAT repeat protein
MTDISALSSSNWRKRKKAIEALAKTPENAKPENLLKIIQENHQNLEALNGAIQLLAVLEAPVVPGLVALLQDPDIETATYAALALGIVNAPDVQTLGVPALLQVLETSCSQQGKVNLCFNIIETLGILRAKPAIDKLRQLARDENYFLAFAAIHALGDIGDPKPVPDLLEVILDDFLSSAAVTALGKMGDPTVIRPIVEWLEAQGEASVAVLALVEVACTVRNPPREYNLQIAREIAEMVGQQGRIKLFAAVPNRDPDELTEDQEAYLPKLARIFGWMLTYSPGEDRQILIENLLHLLAYPGAYSSAEEALITGGRASFKHLASALSTQEGGELKPLDVRIAAASVMGFTNGPASIALLTRALDAVEDELVCAVSKALGQIGHPDALVPLINKFSHPFPGVRREVVNALKRISHPQKIKRMLHLLDDPNEEVRRSALQVLGASTPTEPEMEDVVSAVLASLTDPSPAVRRAAVEVLPGYSDPQIPGALTEAARDRDPTIRSAGMRALSRTPKEFALPLLYRGLGDPDPWVRMYSCRSLAVYGDAVSVEKLKAMKGDPMPPVRLALIETLRSIGSPEALELLNELLLDSVTEVQDAAENALAALKLEKS